MVSLYLYNSSSGVRERVKTVKRVRDGERLGGSFKLAKGRKVSSKKMNMNMILTCDVIISCKEKQILATKVYTQPEI